MATYTKTVWNTGDLITADKMNKVETQLETVTPGATGAVRSDTSQSLNDTEKATARTNIAAASTADITALNNNLNSAETSIAPAFGTSTNYAVGDLVIYNNKLYRFITAHAAGAWDINQVEEVNIADQLEKKANTDGYYEGLNVGSADQLNSTIYVEDNQPYTFRTSGGNADIGDKVEDMVVGGTIAWNQLVQNGNFTTTSGLSPSNGTVSVSNNVMSYTVTTLAPDDSGWSTAVNMEPAIIAPKNHKILICADYKPAHTHTAYVFCMVTVGSGANQMVYGDCMQDVWNKVQGIVTVPTRAEYIKFQFAFYDKASTGYSVNDVDYLRNFCAFDLTQMFGTTIADYIYTLEQTTAGAGVAWFKKLFPKPYYEYNAGELISVAAAKKIATGFNQWDEKWEVGAIRGSDGVNVEATAQIRSKNFLAILPSTTYYCKTPTGYSINIFFYDADKNYLEFVTKSDTTIVTPLNARYFKISTSNGYGTTYKNDICINLSWSGYRNGEYEPSHQSTTEFDPNLELRGIAKLDANNNLYYDGDTYESDGTVTRRYSIADLGTLSWSYNSTYNVFLGIGLYLQSKLSTKRGICSKYPEFNIWITDSQWASADKFISLDANDNYIRIKDTAYSDAETFAAAMSGVYLVYELATPTTEESIPFTKFAYVNDFGTEEFVDSLVEKGTRDVSMPVGHESKYLANLRDKLQHLPDSTSEDGIFVIKQENKQMEIQPFKGYYPDVTVDTANQLAATQYESDKVPYKFRTTGGSADVGNRAYVDKIVGGTVCWNQNIDKTQFGATATNNGVTFTNNGDGSITAVGTASGGRGIFAVANVQVNINHVYLFGEVGSQTTDYWFGNSTWGYDLDMKYMWKPAYAGNIGLNIMVAEGATVNHKFWPKYFDLTQMFGSTIADYIYSLEQTTAGAGVAWFKSLFPADYYAYNAGKLLSVSGLQSHDTVGFNQWDEEWEVGTIRDADGSNISYDGAIRSKNYIPVLPSTNYYFKVPAGFNGAGANSKFYWFDENKNYIGVTGSRADVVSTTPSNCHYIRFALNGVNTYNYDICINLSLNGSRNGEYEPYEKHSYPLDDSLTLKGIPKLDAANKLYFDGDEYAADGTVNRQCVEIDLGERYWEAYPSVEHVFSAVPLAAFTLTSGAVCPKYYKNYLSWNEFTNSTANAIHYDSNGRIYIKDFGYTDAAAFKAAMSGVMLVYKLATPTTEEAEPYNPVQICDDWGTEEFVSNSIVPVGHETRYPANLRNKVQHLPSPAANNGTYVISQNNSLMTLVPLTTPTELPAAPSSNGTYKLRCVVSNGTATYSWVADS